MTPHAENVLMLCMAGLTFAAIMLALNSGVGC